MPKRKNARALVSTLSVRPAFLLHGRRYALRNFSENGLGVWMPKAPPESLAVGSAMTATIEVDGASHPLKGEVRHYENGVLGLKALEMSEVLRKRLSELAAPARLAATLRLQPVSADDEAQSDDGWLRYSDGNETELELRYNRTSRLILKVRIAWEGRWAFRELQGLPVTGLDRTAHDTPDALVFAEAGSLLAAMPEPLPGHLLWQFLESGEQVYLPERAVPAKRAA